MQSPGIQMESNIPWVGTLPRHWRILPLFTGCAEHQQRNTGNVQSNVLSLSYGQIVRRDIESNHGLLPESFETYNQVAPGDVVLRLTDLQNDVTSLRVGIVREPGIVTSAYVTLRARNTSLLPSYLYYLLHAYDVIKVFYGLGAGVRQSVKFEDLKRLPLLLPPIEEQEAIAQFLDRKIAAIDALLEKKERLIALLQEKRQALITHAVTQGLDPAVQLKESGIEWVGFIPSHWNVLPLKRLARPGSRTFTDGDWIEAPFITDSGVRLIQTGNIGTGFYKEQGFRYVSDSTFARLRCTPVEPGNVLICRLDGPVGRACLAPDLGVRMITSVDNAILKPSFAHDARYIVYLLSVPKYLDWVQAMCRVGGGFRFRVSRSMLGDFRLPVPPKHEQIAIADRLDQSTSHIQAVILRLEQSCERIVEYRQALIAAVVTGKFDLPPKAA